MLAFHQRGAGRAIWKALVGIAYIAFGVYLLMHPLLGVASLTLLLASLFLIEAVFDIVLYARLRPAQGSSWILFDGLVTLVLSILIWAHWPSSSAWAIGTLVGVSMIMSGVARVMMSLAVRHVNCNHLLAKGGLRDSEKPRKPSAIRACRASASADARGVT